MCGLAGPKAGAGRLQQGANTAFQKHFADRVHMLVITKPQDLTGETERDRNLKASMSHRGLLFVCFIAKVPF